MPRKGKNYKKMGLMDCCRRRSQTLSDSEEEFDDIRRQAHQKSPDEESPINSPRISSGSPPARKTLEVDEVPSTKVELTISEPAEPDLMIDDSQKISIGLRANRQIGDTIPVDDELTNDVAQKSVHFEALPAQEAKDTRDLYRNTPMKEKRSRMKYEEEYFFVKSRDADEDFVKIKISELKNYVHDYVRKIVESALAAVVNEDFEEVQDKLITAETESIDDGISVSDSEESDMISDMVDEMLADISKAIVEEKAPPTTPRSIDECSDSDASTVLSVKQVESASSLEWDGYEPVLRPDPAYTDVTALLPTDPGSSALMPSTVPTASAGSPLLATDCQQ